MIEKSVARILISLFLLLVFSCKEEEAPPTPPTLSTFTPTSGPIGTVVTITGTDFSPNILANEVKFNGTAATVSSANATSISVAVPNGATTGKISITTNGTTVTSPSDFTVIPTTITSVVPNTGAIGATITITGTGFSAASIVKFGTVQATTTQVTETTIKATVPQGAVTAPITVTNGNINTVSSSDFKVAKEVATIGGVDYENGYGLAMDNAGNSYVIGTFKGTVTIGTTVLTSLGQDDIIIAKFDPNLDPVWVKQVGGTNTDSGYRIVVDGNNNAYIIGRIFGTVDFGPINLHSNGQPAFIAKMSSSGDFIWARLIGDGVGAEYIRAATFDNSGGLYICGEFSGGILFNAIELTAVGQTDGYFAKVDTGTGEILWVNQISSNDDLDFIRASALAVDGSGNIFVSGSVRGSITIGTTSIQNAGNLDGYVAKFNPNGTAVWAKHIGGGLDDNALAVAVNSSGECIVGGYFANTATAFGTSITGDDSGTEEIFVAKLNGSDGSTIWLKKAGGTQYDRVEDMALDATGNIYITGNFTFNATFGSITISHNGNGRVPYVAKLSPAGDFLWAQRGGANGSGGESGMDILVTQDNVVYSAGYFTGIASFGATQRTSAGFSDIYLWRIFQ